MNERRLVYFLLCCGCITISFPVAAIAAAIPAISRAMQLPDITVSQIIPYYMIPYGIGALLYAPLTKKYSYRAILALSMALFGVASLYCAVNRDINHFYIGRIAMGLMGASAIPLGLIVIGQLFERDIRGRLVGLFFSCSFVSSIIGIVLSGVANWRWLFFIPGILGILTGLGFLLYRSDLTKKIHGADVNYLKAFKDVKIRNVFLFIFAISFLFHGVHKWFGVYLSRDYGMEQILISSFFILIAVSSAFGQIAGGFISDKKGRYVACEVGLIMLAFSTVALITHYPLVLLAIILCLISIGWTIGHNGVSTVLTDFPEENRPEIASLNSSVRFVSGGLGFYVSSLFVEKSFGLTFFVFGLLMFALSFLLKKVIPRH